MSYHLYIKRNSQHKDRVGEIALRDWLAAVERDDAFSFIVNEGDSGSAIFDGAKDPEQMIWSNGNIDVDTPSEPMLAKMVELANSLDAKIVGPTGDSYRTLRRD